jgi:rubrerythrin
MPTRIDRKLSSELKILEEKEREMRLFYDRLLKRVEDPRVRKVVESIRKQETKHEGYVKMIRELVSLTA